MSNNNHTNWTIHVTTDDPPDIIAVIPDDGTRGLVVGERVDVQRLADALDHYLVTGEHDGVITRRHWQLGYRWIGTAEAVNEYGAAHSSVTLACRRGDIDDARKDRHGWEFPETALIKWLATRPGSGRRATKP